MIKAVTKSIMNMLSDTVLFSQVSATDLKAIAENYSTVKPYKKGDVVFSVNTTQKCIGVILEGSVTVKKDNIVINQLKSGDLFGAVTLYNQSEHFVNNIVAKADCRVVFVSKEGVDFLISKSPKFAKRFIEYLSQRIYFLNSKIEGYTMPTADEKLLNFLEGKAVNGKAVIDVKMTDLAKSLNLSRASLYRAFDELEADKKITKEGKNIILL